MKKQVLLLVALAALTFSCSDDSDDNDDENPIENLTEDTDDVLFGEAINENDIIEIIAGGETYSFNYYYVLEDEKNNYKSISCFNNDDGGSTMSISIVYATEEGESDRIGINFNSDSKTLTNFYSYETNVFQDNDPQDIDLEIIEDSEKQFIVNFNGIMSSVLRGDPPSYDIIEVSNAVIDITF